MMRRILYFAALLAMLLMPRGRGTDVSELAPAQILYIYIEEDVLAVQTDLGEIGTGLTLERAIRNMEESADRRVFLDTVDYILVTEETKEYLDQLKDVLRPGAKPVVTTADVDLEKAGPILDCHKPRVRLCDYVANGQLLPKLMKAEGRWYLVQ